MSLQEKKPPSYLILSYYHFISIPDPKQEVASHKAFFKEKQLTSRIYISDQGINGQMSGIREDVEAYMQWMQEHPLFHSIIFKVQPYHENVFPKKTIKHRKQLVALDEEVDLTKTGKHITPTEWNKMLNQKEDHIILDVRNSYEWEVGRFEGAECPPCETFREFSEYVEELQKKVNAQTTPIMMYCTGGIRCELYSSLLKKKGFQKVYQLEGGILNYGLKQGSEHWLGKLFVFDDRLTVPISEEETTIIGKCIHCQNPIESYYNCANMECNKLFLCCKECLKNLNGCCSVECQAAPKVRPYQQQDAHKPFRKWYHYFNNKEKC